MNMEAVRAGRQMAQIGCDHQSGGAVAQRHCADFLADALRADRIDGHNLLAACSRKLRCGGASGGQNSRQQSARRQR